jgi:hypothetical protein
MQIAAVETAGGMSAAGKGGQVPEKDQNLKETPFAGLLGELLMIETGNKEQEAAQEEEMEITQMPRVLYPLGFCVQPEEEQTQEIPEGNYAKPLNKVPAGIENTGDVMLQSGIPENTDDEEIPVLFPQTDEENQENLQAKPGQTGNGEQLQRGRTDRPGSEQQADSNKPIEGHSDETRGEPAAKLTANNERGRNQGEGISEDKPIPYEPRLNDKLPPVEERSLVSGKNKGEEIGDLKHRPESNSPGTDFWNQLESKITYDRSEHQSKPPEGRDFALIDQVVNKMKIMIGSRKTEISMQLKPESLGRLSLKLTVVDGVLNGKMIVQNNQAKSLIQANLAELRESLEQQGIPVSKFQVNVGGGGEYKQQQFFQENRQTFHGKPTADPYGEIEEEEFISWKGEGTIELLA